MKFGMGLFQKKRINVIIQDHVIRFLDLKQPELLEVRNSGERFLPAGLIQDGRIIDRETLLIILEECVAEWGIKGREVQFLIPDGKLVLRKLRIPADMSPEDIKGYLYMELGSSIHLPFEDPVFDYVLLEDEGEGNEILLFAASENIIQDYSSLLEDAKLKPVVADTSFLALYRLIFLQNLASEDDHMLCMEFDISSVQLSVFHKHKPRFYNHLKMETDMKSWNFKYHTTDIAEIEWQGDNEFMFGMIEDMMLEIDRIIDFYQFSLYEGEQRISKIVLTGEHPELRFVMDRLKSRVNVPVVRLQHQNDSFPSRFDLVFGLGLKEVALC
ncbi:type IV pilus biogenesis protein PilM [Fictibacillus aquaticus]|uniref:Pilus assembly protein PilM n=1 Tax=Fictibacillus aquaticus TaxID=2021314 RepID=A0A235FFL2_9BACL|nr:pilus assembly protein PilM [Fictibacillus aquaticus]OYD59727.1 hypothetical protein CGZ90_07555 [Fictibacillus aquaticus]